MDTVRNLQSFAPWINDDIYLCIRKFLEHLQFAQKKMNLTGSLNMDDIFEHLLESLAFFPLMKIYSYQSSLSLFDIGSGGGFPAIPLALSQPDWEIVMSDSIRKKTTFLDWVKQSFQMKQVEVYHGRVEQFFHDYPHRKFDIVTARGVGKTTYLVDLASHLLKPMGFLVLWKSVSEVENEIGKGEFVKKNHYTMTSGKELVSLQWISEVA